MNLIKKAILTTTIILLIGFKAAFAQTQCESYIKEHLPQATELSIEYGIPSSIIIAVAIIESGSGTGWATTHMNNHFGIVGSNRQKKRNTRYKQYITDAASFRHFCEVMATKSFYPSLRFNYEVALWADAISRCGYSEKPELWKMNVMQVIEDNHLTN